MLALCVISTRKTFDSYTLEENGDFDRGFSVRRGSEEFIRNKILELKLNSSNTKQKKLVPVCRVSL